MRKLTAVCVAIFSATILLFSASLGPSFAETGTNNAIFGDVSWSDPGNITGAGDDSRANATSITVETSQYIMATNFGFGGFTGTVDGVLCEIERYGTQAGTGTLPDDNNIRLVNGAGTVVGDNKSLSNQLPNGSGNEAFASYGGVSDDWNASLVDTDIPDADFGCVFSATLNGDGVGDDSTAFVDSVRVTVAYTPAVGGRRRFVSRNAGLLKALPKTEKGDR